MGIYRSLDAAFSANLSHYLNDGVGKNDKCSMQRSGKGKGYDISRKVDLPQPISEKQVGISQESGNGQMDINQVDQRSQSPPSYGDTKGSDNDSSVHVRFNLLLVINFVFVGWLIALSLFIVFMFVVVCLQMYAGSP